MVRVDVRALRSAHRSLQRQAMVSLVVAAMVGLFGALFVVIGIAMTLSPVREGDVQAGVTCALSGGIVPLVAGTALAAVGLARRRRGERLTALAWLAGREGDAGVLRIAQELSITPASANLLLRDAWALGVLEHAAATAPVALAPTLASPALQAPSPPGRSLVGHVLDRTYKIIGHLGDGAMGTVYAAEHVRMGRRVAIKTLHRDARLSEDAIRRFEREAATAGGLGHPGIVTVHDFDVTADGVHYLVMELLDGETLEQRLGRSGTLPFAQACAIATQIASALAAAHRVGVIHRDVKPANIFLTRAEGRDRAVLVDFGLAKPLDPAVASHITQDGAAIGTPAYMSPEQARGMPLDGRSDVYGLGAVLYEMVTGAPPFFDETAAGVYARLLTEDAPLAELPADCPPALASLLSRALQKDASERFASADAFLSAVASLRPAPPAPVAVAG